MIYDIKQLTTLYLERNDLTISFMARKTGIASSLLWKWLHNQRDLSTKNLRKVKEFLNGNFLISATQIIEEGLTKNDKH